MKTSCEKALFKSGRTGAFSSVDQNASRKVHEFQPSLDTVSSWLQLVLAKGCPTKHQVRGVNHFVNVGLHFSLAASPTSSRPQQNLVGKLGLEGLVL